MNVDINAFESYFKKYYQLVFGYLLKKTGSYYVAEDLTMDSFSICYEHFNKFNSNKANFGTWLYVIVNNKLKNYYRDKKVVDEINDNLPDDNCFEDEIIKSCQIQKFRDDLANAFLLLNDTQRKILALKYYKSKTSVEISEILGLSSVNVRVQCSRAICTIKKHFSENNIRLEL